MYKNTWQQSNKDAGLNDHMLNFKTDNFNFNIINIINYLIKLTLMTLVCSPLLTQRSLCGHDLK